MLRITNTLLLTMIMLLSLCAQQSEDIELLHHISANPGYEYNDVWGFKDTVLDIEYAILGSRQSTLIYDISSDSVEPRLVTEVFLAGRSIWRDMKTWGSYVYGTADNPNRTGLFIIDLTDTSNIKAKSFNPTLPFTPEIPFDNTKYSIVSAHNIYIDEFGYLYVSGANGIPNGEGIIIFDLNENPFNPELVGILPTSYSHDVYVQDGILANSAIYDGQLRLYDVRDKSNMTFLGGVRTSSSFTHNCWFSDDGNYAFTTDERGGAFIDAFDISDPSNIRFLDRYRADEGANGAIPHNAHYHDGYLVLSYYTQGVIVLDVAEPNIMTEVAHYRTSTHSSAGGFNGCWGAFPFLPSGRVLASDIGNGLHILDVDYQRASYLRGLISVDSIAGAKASDAKVWVNGNMLTVDNDGIFMEGIDEDSALVRVEIEGYEPFESIVDLERGVWTEVDIAMEPLSTSIEGPIVLPSTPFLESNLVAHQLSVYSAVDIRSITHLSIIDAAGRTVHNTTGLKSRQINLSDIESGVYHVLVQYKDGTSEGHKFILQR